MTLKSILSMIILLFSFISHSKRLIDSLSLLHSRLIQSQIIELIDSSGVTSCQADLAVIRYGTFILIAIKGQLLVSESQF